jgi:hypothetical protein
MDPRAGLDNVKKRKFLTLPRLELRSLCRAARSQALYRLRYPGPWEGLGKLKNPMTLSGVAWCLNQLRYRVPVGILYACVCAFHFSLTN